MNYIFCIRPAPYTYKLDRHDLYDSYDLVAQGKVSPKVDVTSVSKSLKNQVRKSIVLSSNTPRARQTAAALKDQYIVCQDLKEIEYRMSQLVPRTTFNQFGPAQATTLARKQFFLALFASGLSESHAEVCNRVSNVLELMLRQHKPVIAISHGFFLKFLEIAVLQPEAIHNPVLFTEFYDGSQPTFGFLDGPILTPTKVQKAITLLRG